MCGLSLLNFEKPNKEVLVRVLRALDRNFNIGICYKLSVVDIGRFIMTRLVAHSSPPPVNSVNPQKQQKLPMELLQFLCMMQFRNEFH